MREISVIKGRILHYLESKGITKYTFYKVTGVANGILSQPNGISEDTLRRFLSNYEDVNGDWLLRGEGPMLRTWSYATGAQPDAVGRNRLNDVCAPYNGKYAVGGQAGIPVVGLGAAAETDPTACAGGETVCLPRYAPAEGSCLCFRTEGEAMYPTLLAGSYIVCRLLCAEEWMQIPDMTACVLVTADRKCHIRRLKTLPEGEGFLALADNRDRHNYPTLRFGKDDLFRIWKIEWYMTPNLTESNDTCSEKVRYLEEEVSDLKLRMNRLLPPQK